MVRGDHVNELRKADISLDTTTTTTTTIQRDRVSECPDHPNGFLERERASPAGGGCRDMKERVCFCLVVVSK